MSHNVAATLTAANLQNVHATYYNNVTQQQQQQIVQLHTNLQQPPPLNATTTTNVQTQLPQQQQQLQVIGQQQQQQQQQQSQQSNQATTQQHQVVLNVGNIQINPNTSENSEVPLIIADENAPPQPGPTMLISHVIKSLLKFLAQDTCQPLWNYEDITAKGESYTQP